MNSKVLRQKYLKYFENNGHKIIPSASLIPENDSSSLFTSSGMQPLIPYLMGETHPEGKRLVNSQKSLRSGDIEEVGDNRHTTCFEMLGNWSLGDYFKKEQLNWFWGFLTKEINLDPNRIYVTVFSGNEEIGVERDMESVAIWQEIFKKDGFEALDIEGAEKNGMQGGRIFYYDEAKNWWSRSGKPANMPIGEIGGPDSEVFYDLGANLKRHENSVWKDEPCHVNCDCGRFIEVGNSVFIQFVKTEQGFETLKQKNVDFGGGLERLVMATEGKDNIFETDMFGNILKKISDLSGGKEYRDNMKAFEVIADHMKGATFLMGDDKGIAPSNVDQGYIVRRLIRRALRFGRQLGITEIGWTKDIAQIVIDDYKDVYDELSRNSAFILKETEQEELKFQKTLEKGERQIVGEVIDGETAFNLFQTYGYPREMTEEIAMEKGIKLSENFSNQFDEAASRHQDLSRTASAGKFKGGLADSSEETTRLHTAAHLLLESLRRVLGPHVQQKGSNITSERLRFDFLHGEKMTDEQKADVERMVNDAISKDLPVCFEEMTVEEAKKMGATGVFESKYGEKVKVYSAGRGGDCFSKEICGGPHVERTGSLGTFKIEKESSSSAGVRRIKAVLIGEKNKNF
jgi:alanyl-tRNA synthetase